MYVGAGSPGPNLGRGNLAPTEEYDEIQHS
jgi:hypothetical protein